MIKFLKFLLILFMTLCCDSLVQEAINHKKPNIVVIVADDLGWNDVSFHGSDEIPTPNIDAIGYNGVILNRHYVAAMCTPSRSALMTGKYPIHLGMQHFVIAPDEPWGLPLEEKTLAQYLKEAGYNTNLIGKWHLGFHKKAFNPIQRGFDSFFGYLGAYVDYFDHSLVMDPYSRGYDMRANESIYYESKGKYATELFTEVAIETIMKHETKQPMFMLLNQLAAHAGNDDDPLQAPEEEIAKFQHIKNPNRRVLAAMISIMDRGIGRIVTALKRKGILENTVILFIADNGAPSIGQHTNAGSNYPFRGQKDSPWEGAVRGVAVLWSSLLKNKQIVSNNLVHISDWLPTFAGLAGLNINSSSGLDGMNIWDSISENRESPRKELLHNVDEISGYSAYLKNQWKYVNGSTLNGKYDDWLGELNLDNSKEVYSNFSAHYEQLVLTSEAGKALSELSNSKVNSIELLREQAKIHCTKNDSDQKCSMTKPCLFDIVKDPCEFNNLADTFPEQVLDMKNRVELFRMGAMKPRNKPGDPNCDPSLNGFVWTWWQEEYTLPGDFLIEWIIGIGCAVVVFGVIIFFVLRKNC